MTFAELKAEYDYRIAERLGVLCGSDEPTPEQVAIAKQEAWTAIEQLLADEKAQAQT